MLKCVSPIDNSIYVERPYATDDQIAQALESAAAAAQAWRTTSLEDRAALCTALIEYFVSTPERHA